MNEIEPAAIPETEQQGVLICYILHVLGLINGITSIISVIISHIRVGEVSTEFARSHHRWLIRSFWWSLLWFALGAVTAWILIGVPILIAAGIWWIYRVVRGLLNYIDRKPMPV